MKVIDGERIKKKNLGWGVKFGVSPDRQIPKFKKNRENSVIWGLGRPPIWPHKIYFYFFLFPHLYPFQWALTDFLQMIFRFVRIKMVKVNKKLFATDRVDENSVIIVCYIFQCQISKNGLWKVNKGSLWRL